MPPQAPPEPPSVLLEVPARPEAATAAAPPMPGAPPVTAPPPLVDDERWARKLRGQEAFAEYMREVRAVAVAPGERTRQLVYQVRGGGGGLRGAWLAACSLGAARCAVIDRIAALFVSST